MSVDIFPILSEVLQSNIGTILAGIGLMFVALEFTKNRRQSQVNMTWDVYREIQQLEREIGQVEIDDPKFEEKRDNWKSLFFNAIEWFAFLINRGDIKDADLIDYFKPSIIRYYEGIFLALASEKQKTDEREFEEFKKLYIRFKGEKNVSN